MNETQAESDCSHNPNIHKEIDKNVKYNYDEKKKKNVCCYFYFIVFIYLFSLIYYSFIVSFFILVM